MFNTAGASLRDAFADYVFGAQNKEGIPEEIDEVAEKYPLAVGIIFFSTAS
jgi:hypothetical protein